MYPKTELIAFSDSNLISYDSSDSNLISHDKEKVAESPRSLDPQTVVHATTLDSAHHIHRDPWIPSPITLVSNPCQMRIYLRMNAFSCIAIQNNSKISFLTNILAGPGVGSLGVAGRGSLNLPGVAGRGGRVGDPPRPCQSWLCGVPPACVTGSAYVNGAERCPLQKPSTRRPALPFFGRKQTSSSLACRHRFRLPAGPAPCSRRQ